MTKSPGCLRSIPRPEPISDNDTAPSPHAGGVIREDRTLDPVAAGRRASLEMAIALNARTWQLRLSERLAEAGLTASQWRALRAVAARPEGVGQRELGGLIGVEDPGASRLVDTMEAAGLVTRRVSPTDRRSRIVTVTPAAQPVVTQAQEITISLNHDLFADMPGEEIETCIRLLRRLLHRLQSLRPVAA